jgi:Tfp pilus assembly protein PilN
MESDIAKFKPQIDQVAAFRAKKAELQKKIDVIAGLDRARKGPVRVMDELATHTPERLWLDSVKTKRQIGSPEPTTVRAVPGSPGSLTSRPSTRTASAGRGPDGLKVVKFKIQARSSRPGGEATAAPGRPREERWARAPAGRSKVRRGRHGSIPVQVISIRSPSLRGARMGFPAALLLAVAITRLLQARRIGWRAAREGRSQAPEVRSIAANIAAFEAEIQELEVKLNAALRQLPNEKQLEVLLTDISNLGKTAGIEIKSFKREDERVHDFYAEVPISVAFEGRFHDIARFFDLVSRLPRIVNMGSIQMSVASQTDLDTRLKVTGTATAFRFVGDGQG